MLSSAHGTLSRILNKLSSSGAMSNRRSLSHSRFLAQIALAMFCCLPSLGAIVAEPALCEENVDCSGRVDTPGIAGKVVVVGGYAYVADSDSGLDVIDVSDPPTAHITGRARSATGRVAVGGNYAYVTWIDSMKVINISSPSSPYEVGATVTQGSPWGVATAGSYAFVVNQVDGLEGDLEVIDVSNATAPHDVGIVALPYFPQGLTVVGNYVYVACLYGLLVIDVSNPGSPQIVGSVETQSRACDVVLSGSYAYLASFATGLQVIDVSNPESPYLVSTLGLPDNGLAYGIDISGGCAYLATDCPPGGTPWLHVVDVSIPSSPHLIESTLMQSHPTAVDVAGGCAYVGDYYAGLEIVPADCEITDVLRSDEIQPAIKVVASPNPSHGRTEISLELPNTSQIDICVYNIAGRLIRRVFKGILSPGRHALSWDCLDDKGQGVAQGVYLIRLTTKEGVKTEKLILLR
jgi:hypothetical protein